MSLRQRPIYIVILLLVFISCTGATCSPVSVKIDYALTKCSFRDVQVPSAYENDQIKMRQTQELGVFWNYKECPGYKQYLVEIKNEPNHKQDFIYIKVDSGKECKVEAVTAALCHNVSKNGVYFPECETYGEDEKVKAVQLGDEILRPEVEALLSQSGLKTKPGYINGTRIGNKSDFDRWCKDPEHFQK